MKTIHYRTSTFSPELPTPEREGHQSLESVVEEGQAEGDAPGGDDQSASGEGGGSAVQKKTSPSFPKRSRRSAEAFRLSAVIKLDYDLSDPIYAVIKDLILKYVLMWVLPSNNQQRGGISGSPAPSPLLPRRPKFVPSGVELMRDMWFTSRDNVSMLLEICRQGFQTPLFQTYTLRKLIGLYFHWEQVKVVKFLTFDSDKFYACSLLPPTLSLSLSLSLTLFLSLPFTHTHPDFCEASLHAGAPSAQRRRSHL